MVDLNELTRAAVPLSLIPEEKHADADIVLL